jgi:hypothetical protein
MDCQTVCIQILDLFLKTIGVTLPVAVFVDFAYLVLRLLLIINSPNYLSVRGVKWILVTHLHELFDRFTENEIMKMTSDKGANKYKFVKI